MHVLADGGTLAHRCDHRLAEVPGLRAREADTLEAGNGIAGPEQLAELGADRRGEVAPPRVHVLAEQRDLADAVAGEPLDLGEDVARPTALLAPADGRDDAV